jgi:hypothetical protein
MKIEPILITKKTINDAKLSVDAAIVQYLDKIPTIVSRILDGVVQQYLGISKSFGRVEFKHDSIVYKLINVKAKKVVEKLVDSLTWEPTPEELKKVKTAALDQYRKTLQSWINTRMRDVCEKRTKKFEEEFIGIEILLEELKAPTVEEMANPDYGHSELEKALMEAQIEVSEKKTRRHT